MSSKTRVQIARQQTEWFAARIGNEATRGCTVETVTDTPAAPASVSLSLLSLTYIVFSLRIVTI